MSQLMLPELSSPYAVSDRAVSDFTVDGHVSLRAVASPEEVAVHRDVITAAVSRLSTERRPLSERDTYGKAFLQVSNLWQQDDGVAAFVLADRFAGIAARLLGARRVRVYHDQALFKEPGGGRTPWHQDALYWPLDGSRCLTMWMPLVGLEPDMGGMAFASGTHLSGSLSDETISDASDADFERILAGGEHPVARTGRMAAGDATFHGGWTVHEALPNRSDIMREVMTVIYFADGERVAEPKNPAQRTDLETWLPGLLPGAVAASPLNPALPRAA